MPAMTKARALGFAKSDAAVVTGRLRRTRTVNDQRVTDDWRSSRYTYVMRARGRW
jgi:hypothetical protein